MKTLNILTIITMIALLFATPSIAQQVPAAADANASAGASGTGVVGDINSGNTSVGRSAIVPADITFPGAPAHFDKATPDGRFIPLQNIFLFQNTYSAVEAKNILDSAEGDMDLKIRPLVAVDKDTVATEAVAMATLMKDENGNTVLPGTMASATRVQLAMGTVMADGVDAISVDLLAAIVDDACKRGATHVIFLGEGVNRIIKSFSWGLGLSSSYAHMSDSGDDGTLTTGGVGVSGGEAGYKHLPWLQFVVIKAE